jgi:hypothetical protein
MGTVRPDPDSAIVRAGSKQLLLDTYIESINSFAVKTRNEVLKLIYFVGSL